MSTDESSTAALPTGSPCWVEVPALDVQRAKQFYASVWNWTFTANPPNTAYTDDNIAMFNLPGGQLRGGIVKKCEAYLQKQKMVYLYAQDLDAQIEKIKQAKGKVVGERYAEGDFGLIQEFEDTEGNLGGMYTMVKK